MPSRRAASGRHVLAGNEHAYPRLRRVKACHPIASFRTIFLGFALFACAAPAGAAEPQLGLILPCGGQRGTELDITLSGERLGDARELLWYGPGIGVKRLAADAKHPQQVEARLAIRPDCPLGPHAVRVRTSTGISNLMTFSVGTLCEVSEVEPNNDIEHAQKIALGTTVNGVITNEDVDCFLVVAKKGQRITAEVEGLRLGLDFFDPALAIMDTRRFVLASADDTPAVWQDAICSILAPADGNYVIELRESAFQGSQRCRYRLHVGSFPRPLAACPAGGRFGETLEVRWLGDAAGPWTERIPLPAVPQLDFGYCARDAQGMAPWPTPLRLSKLRNVLKVEPNHQIAQATRFQAPAALNGVIAQPGDVDYFRFAAKRGQVFDVRVLARALRSPLDSVLTVLRSGGGVVAANDDANGPDSYLRFTAPADDDYIVQVTDQLHAGGPTYVYRIEVTPVEPQLTLGLPEREAFVDVTVPVAQGNRMAALVSAQRDEFGGKVDLEFKNLPPGVKVETEGITEADGAAAVLFTAAPDAALGGSLVDVIGRATVGPTRLEGHLKQRTSLVRGQNNREVWNQYTDRMATAVTRAAPVAIEVVEPKAPLVQGGAMELRVIATRRPGFDGPITLTLLATPPGVSTTSSVTMAGGEREASIPLTADGSARTGPAKLIVLGHVAIDGGTVVVASRFAKLEISEPFFRFTFPTVTVEQGQAAELAIAVAKNKEFTGTAKVDLLGLPAEVTSQPRQLDAAAKEIVFPIQTSGKSPLGKHRALLCRAVVTVAGEPVTHLLGTGELRIQKPTPAKPAEAAKPKAAVAKTAAPVVKRLSRLEQLRQARAQVAAAPQGRKP